MLGLLVANIFYVFVGYVIAVLFPFPWLSSAVLDFWAAFGAKIKSFFSNLGTSSTTTTPVTEPVVTTPVAPVAPVATTPATPPTESPATEA